MKKLLLGMLMIVFGFTANAQGDKTSGITFGAKAGVNIANVSGDDVDDASSRTSMHLGVVAEIPISEKFSFQPELLYSSQGAKLEFGFGAEYEVKLNYISIPLMAKYYVAEGFSLEAGPQISFLIKDEVEGEGTTGDLEDFFGESPQSTDFGLNFGLGYKLESGFNFGARYNLGFSEFIEDSDAKNSVFQVSVGYFF